MSGRVFRPPHSLTLCIWNTRALIVSISSTSFRADRRFRQARQLLGRYQVARFQETHGRPTDLIILSDEIHPGILCEKQGIWRCIR
eukprot:521604-Pyramimonas_sp.AAC.1